LFKGTSCFPLSPLTENKEKNVSNKESTQAPQAKSKKKVVGKDDQVRLILKALGPQSSNDLSFLTSTHAVKYVAEL